MATPQLGYSDISDPVRYSDTSCPNETGIQEITNITNSDGSHQLRVSLCSGYGFDLVKFRSLVAESVGLQAVDNSNGVGSLYANQPEPVLINGVYYLTEGFTIPVETTSETSQCNLNIPLSDGTTTNLVISADAISGLIPSAVSRPEIPIVFETGAIAGSYLEPEKDATKEEIDLYLVIVCGIGLIAVSGFPIAFWLDKYGYLSRPKPFTTISCEEPSSCPPYEGEYLGIEWPKHISDEEKLTAKLRAEDAKRTPEEWRRIDDEAYYNKHHKSSAPHDGLARAHNARLETEREGRRSMTVTESDKANEILRQAKLDDHM